MTLRELLVSLNACSEAIKWVGDKGLATAWAECQRGDWMLWLADALQVDHKMRVRCALGCARMVEDNAKDYPAVKECNDTVERWLSGNATQDKLMSAASAASAAWSAASAASAAWSAASAAWSAASAASAAWSAESAESAAWSAESAASAVSAKQANLVRSIIPLSEIERCIADREVKA